jgi:ubiquitin-protein ligase
MAMKRVLADIAELQKPLYAEQGIFYEANPNNTMEGRACVFGPPGTPYEGCPMFYKFTLPTTYPFDPPYVKFETYDGVTRFHPNMYVEGKVCLSILHTWSGPKWASTMRISTVLLTLQSLMDTAPMRHEPSYEIGKDDRVANYSYIVSKACINYVLKLAETKKLPDGYEDFQEEFEKRLPAFLETAEERIDHSEASRQSTPVVVCPYGTLNNLSAQQLKGRVVKLKATGSQQSK